MLAQCLGPYRNSEGLYEFSGGSVRFCGYITSNFALINTVVITHLCYISLASDCCRCIADHKVLTSVKRSAQVQYNCNTRIFFLYCSCIAIVRTAAIQQNFCVILLLLYCSCIALVRTALLSICYFVNAILFI